jgi:phage replication-related protein YjqB (UPF0714/DUF867 family)
MLDKYRSFVELAQNEIEGRDYCVRTLVRPKSPVLLIAPHGGGIEPGTCQLAELIAGKEHNLFCFQALRQQDPSDLHITSHRFDHPALREMLLRCAVAVAIHGCTGERQIYVAGLDLALRTILVARLNADGFPATAEGHSYPGTHPTNVCNRTTRSCGAQLELTADWRERGPRITIANTVASAIAEYLREFRRASKALAVRGDRSG